MKKLFYFFLAVLFLSLNLEAVQIFNYTSKNIKIEAVVRYHLIGIGSNSNFRNQVFELAPGDFFPSLKNAFEITDFTAEMDGEFYKYENVNINTVVFFCHNYDGIKANRFFLKN